MPVPRHREITVFRIIKRAPWIAIGAAGAWFLDPICGPERRAQAKRKAEDLLGGNTNAPTSIHDELTDPLREHPRTANAAT